MTSSRAYLIHAFYPYYLQLQGLADITYYLGILTILQTYANLLTDEELKAELTAYTNTIASNPDDQQLWASLPVQAQAYWHWALTDHYDKQKYLNMFKQGLM